MAYGSLEENVFGLGSDSGTDRCSDEERRRQRYQTDGGCELAPVEEAMTVCIAEILVPEAQAAPAEVLLEPLLVAESGAFNAEVAAEPSSAES